MTTSQQKYTGEQLEYLASVRRHVYRVTDGQGDIDPLAVERLGAGVDARYNEYDASLVEVQLQMFDTGERFWFLLPDLQDVTGQPPASERDRDAMHMHTMRVVARNGGITDDEFGLRCQFCYWSSASFDAKPEHDGDCIVPLALMLYPEAEPSK